MKASFIKLVSAALLTTGLAWPGVTYAAKTGVQSQVSSRAPSAFLVRQADGQNGLTSAGQQLAPNFVITTDHASYQPYQKIVVSWSGFPAGKNSEIWINPISQPADQPPGNWLFLSAPSGSMTFDGFADAGTYAVRVMMVSPMVVIYQTTIQVGNSTTSGGGTNSGSTGSNGSSSGSSGNTNTSTEAQGQTQKQTEKQPHLPSGKSGNLIALGKQLTPNLSVSTNKPHYTPFDPITVNWTGLPGSVSGQLWIEHSSDKLVPPKSPDGQSSSFMDSANGSVTFSDLRLAPGKYDVRVEDMTVANGHPPLVYRVSFQVVKTKLPQGASNKSGSYGARVWTPKTNYAPNQPINVKWTNVPNGHTVKFWFEKKGAPLEIGPSGAYHTTDSSSGSFALTSPGPGAVWQIQWEDESVQPLATFRGNTFTVGASKANLPKGHYGCYFYQTQPYGLSRSSISYVVIDSSTSYHTPEGAGKLTYNKSTQTMKMTSGPLSGRVAELINQSGLTGEAAIYFPLKLNLSASGKATIDIGDTTCYLNQK